jgi:hypothetical protein
MTLDKVFMHQMNCEFGSVTCEYCSAEIQKDDYLNHRNTCHTTNHQQPAYLSSPISSTNKAKIKHVVGADSDEDDRGLDVTTINNSI